jgi:(S)-sulfolactate dehydrogenase
MGARPKVLLVFPLADPSAQQRLSRDADVIIGGTADPATLAQLLADADGVIVRPPARLDRDALNGAPKLRIIANIGAGLDHIDTEAASARGIPIAGGAGANARAVAEYVIWAMLALSRRLSAAAAEMHDPSSDWASRVARLRGHELAGQTLGIAGYGHIGKALGGMARALGMRVAAYDPYRAPAPGDVDQVCAGLDELLDAAQILSVHVPLTDGTRGLIDGAALDRLGPDGVLVNSSRGGVVDEDAVVTALRESRLRGAAWDVFDPEPPQPGRLAELATVPGLLLTPHIAGISAEAGSALAWQAVEAVLAVLCPGEGGEGGS